MRAQIVAVIENNLAEMLVKARRQVESALSDSVFSCVEITRKPRYRRKVLALRLTVAHHVRLVSFEITVDRRKRDSEIGRKYIGKIF